METNATKRTDLFWIDPRNIDIQDGFNVRREFDLDELKEQIKAQGVLNPITVIPYIKALKAPKDAKPEDLYIEQMMRNEGKKFTEYECAIMFQRFKDEFGYSQVQIADKFKKSPAFISKCLSLLDLPSELQEKIVSGQLSVKAAREIAGSYETEQEQVKAAGSAVKSAQSEGRSIATNKEVLNALKTSKEAKSVADALRTLWAYLDGDNVIDIDQMAKLLDKHESLNKAVREYKSLNKPGK